MSMFLWLKFNKLRRDRRGISKNGPSTERERVFVHKSSVSLRPATQLSAVSAHFVHQRGDAFHRRMLRDAMAKIEHVARRGAECVEHAAYRMAHAVGRREKGRRIEIALQSDTRANAGARRGGGNAASYPVPALPCRGSRARPSRTRAASILWTP